MMNKRKILEKINLIIDFFCKSVRDKRLRWKAVSTSKLAKGVNF
jgi:hypothetical protein